jgi:hypothetical protein
VYWGGIGEPWRKTGLMISRPSAAPVSGSILSPHFLKS